MGTKKTLKTFNTVKDSGQRREFGTGAVRDMAEGKGRYDLLPVLALRRLAKHFENGARKYGIDNWKKGIPVRAFLDSGTRHAFKAIAGLEDEDHLSAAAWNFLCALETQIMVEMGILPEGLDDLPKLTKEQSEAYVKAMCD